MARSSRRGFTLIELMTVMAISAILLGLIAWPVIQSFNLTRAAQGMADSQARARVLVTQIERDLAQGAGVRNNTGYRGATDIVVPGLDGSPEVVRLDQSRIDVVAPAQGDPGRGASGAYINPNTGKEDPTLMAPKGQVVLPVAQGTTIVRYFVGLRDPFRPYNNPHDNLLTKNAAGQDNLYVLYRAEVVPSTRFFPLDASNNLYMDDPAFFALLPGTDLTNGGALTPAGQAKAARIHEWLRVAKVVTEINRYDAIMPIFDKQSKKVVYDGNVPRIVSLVQFSPKRVANEAAAGMMAVRSGEEAENAQKVGPDVFEAQYGGWTNALVRVYPSIFPTAYGYGPGETLAGYVRSAWQTGTPYLVVRSRRDGDGNEQGISVFAYDPTAGGEKSSGVELFDITTYQALAGPNPNAAFTAAVQAADSRSGWLSNSALRRLFIAVTPSSRSGKLVAGFDVREVGQDASSDHTPYAATGAAYTPNNDPDTGSGVWSDATFQSVNRRFNKLWVDWATLMPDLDRSRFVKRFIDLRLIAAADGTPSPLHPGLGFPRAFITPGSEVVVGPDQRPGPNYGAPVRYSRVSRRPVGPNEYYINYVNLPEPNYPDLGILTTSAPFDPESYDAKNLVSAIIQPQYRVGYLELNSRFGEPIPAGNIYVSYRFQFTEPNDVVSVDYDSAQALDVLLTIRYFAQSGSRDAQLITVKGSAKVRNFLR